jgi:hypothetical protein
MTSAKKIQIVVATRVTEAEFFKNTATGRSLFKNRPPNLSLRIFVENTEGLAGLYNQAIHESNDRSITLVFAHDDLHFLDYHWCDRIHEGLTHFDILGLAGNIRRVPKQPSWMHVNADFTRDEAHNLSGVVAHGTGFPPENISRYGPVRQRVKLLDGLLLAVKNTTCLTSQLMFDERFLFHFYDLDFCRQAETKNLSCGTWDIAVAHVSGGHFGSEAWKIAYKSYISKWSD